MKFIKAAKLSELPPGSCLSVDLDNDHSIALFNVDGELFALENTCPHAGGPLGEGTLHGEIVKCPWHGWKFNVRTGQCLKNPISNWSVSCFPLRVEKGIIHIAFGQEASSSKERSDLDEATEAIRERA